MIGTIADLKKALKEAEEGWTPRDECTLGAFDDQTLHVFIEGRGTASLNNVIKYDAEFGLTFNTMRKL